MSKAWVEAFEACLVYLKPKFIASRPCEKSAMCVRNICCSTSLTAIKGFKDFQPGCHIHTMAINSYFLLPTATHILGTWKSPSLSTLHALKGKVHTPLPTLCNGYSYQLWFQPSFTWFCLSSDNASFQHYPFSVRDQFWPIKASNEKYAVSFDLALFIRKPILD